MMSHSPIALMRATALHTALLSGGASIPAVHCWRARCVTLVEELRQDMKDTGCPGADIEEASLSTCVLLDELTLDALPSTWQGEWMREPLQVRFHGLRDGAERVWKSIDALLIGERHDPVALELYGIVLELGFSGGRNDADMYRQRVKSTLNRRGHSDASNSTPASIDPAVTMMSAVPPPRASRKRWLAYAAIAAAVTIPVLWIAFDVSLSAAIARLPGASSGQVGLLPQGRS